MNSLITLVCALLFEKKNHQRFSQRNWNKNKILLEVFFFSGAVEVAMDGDIARYTINIQTKGNDIVQTIFYYTQCKPLKMVQALNKFTFRKKIYRLK